MTSSPVERPRTAAERPSAGPVIALCLSVALALAIALVVAVPLVAAL